MKQAKGFLTVVFPCFAMLMLILDSKTSLLGAQQGLDICVRTVIPSLFPFFVISILVTGAISNYPIPVLRPILRFCKMPLGSEGLLIVGFLGGYPIGAKCVYDSWKRGQISKKDAIRCLGFCSNAGPAFIFGMCGVLFSKTWIIWVLWGIHILSALLVGNLLPANKESTMRTIQSEPISISEAMKKAISAILSVCGWVILFRVLITFCQHWFLWLLPANWRIAFEGVLELANGCSSLLSAESEGVRFVLCAVFLGLGGLCVGLQTVSVVGELGTGMYFPGKALQGLISCCLAALFASFQYHLCSPVLPIIATLILILLMALKKTVDFPKRLVYNVEKNWKGDFLCYSERKLQNPAAIAPVEQK